MLTLPEIFESDIQGNTTNLHPIVTIATSPQIHLSQTDEVIDGNHYKGVNLKVPSIKESIDLETRNLKINNITITISNHDKFSDRFSTEKLLDKFVYVYWKSQSCTSTSECLLVYKAVIKRVDHDYDTVKFILEDLTQSIVHKQVPINVIDESIAISEKYKNAVAPMVYGGVDRAPCVLYSGSSGATGGNYHRWIYVSPDAPGEFLRSSGSRAFTGHSFGNSAGYTINTGLFIFTGRYLNVMHDYHFINEDNSTFNYLNKQQFSSLTDPGQQGRARLLEQFRQEIPKNPIADNLMQVTVLRMAKSVNLIDSDSSGLEYLGSENDIYIQDESNLADYSKYNIYNEFIGFDDSYAQIPDASLNSVETYEIDEEGFMPITYLRNGTSLGSLNTDNPYPLTTDGGSIGFWGQEHVFETMRSTWHYIMMHLEDFPVEVVCLPESKIVHDWFLNWVDANPDIAPIDCKEWDSGTSKAMWSNTMMVENRNRSSSTMKTLGVYGIGWANWMENDRLYDIIGAEGNSTSYLGNSRYWGTYSSDCAGYATEQPFPPMLFRIDTNTVTSQYADGSGSHKEYGWVVWNRDYMGNAYSDENYDNLPAVYGSTGEADLDGFPGRIYKNFWELMEENGYMHADNPNFDPENYSDIPRFKIDGLNERIEEDGKYIADYIAKWNMVDKNVYGNLGISGGYTNPDVTGDNGGYSAEYCYPPFRMYNVGTYGNVDIDLPNIHNPMHSNDVNWYIHFKEDYIGNGGGRDIKIRKGHLLPYRAVEYYGTGSGNNYQEIATVKGKFFPGEFFNADSSFLTMQAGTSFTTEQRLGLIYTLEDSGVSDNISGKGATQPFVNVAVSLYDEQPSENINTQTYLRINWLQGEITGTSQDTNDIGELFSRSTDYISGDNSPGGLTVENSYIDSNILFSSEWTDPDDFNSGILRYRLTSSLASAQFDFYTRISHLGVMHLLEIKDVLKQDFYLYTGGRVCTGSSSTLCNSSNIIEDIVAKELEVNFSLDSSWDSIKNSMGSNWKLAFSQTDRVNSKKLIEDIAKSTPLIPLIKSNYKLAATMIHNTYSSSDKIIKASDVISSSFTRTKIENVKTMVRVRYKKDYARNLYSEKTFFTDAYDFYGNANASPGYPNGYDKEFYGLDPYNYGDSVLDINSDFIRSRATANNLRDFLLAYHCNQHNIIKLKLPIKYIYLEIADIIEFDSLINGIKCYGEDYTNNSTYRNGQQIYKYFIVTSITKSIDSISIECEQMHNLERNSDVISSGSGDITRNNTYGDDQDQTELQEYLAGSRPYFTEGQMKNADMDGNGKIDDNDLSIMIELATIAEEEEVEEFEEEEGGGEPVGFEHQTIISQMHWQNFDSFNTTNYAYYLTPSTGYFDNYSFDNFSNSSHNIFQSYDEVTENVPYIFGENALDVGWYIQVGNEIMMVDHIEPQDTLWTKVYTQRGMFGTTPAIHNAGEIVTFWSSEPTEGVITEEEVNTSQEPDFQTLLIEHTTDAGYHGIMDANEGTVSAGANLAKQLLIPVSLIMDSHDDLPSSQFQQHSPSNHNSYYWLEDHSIFTDHVDCFNTAGTEDYDNQWYLDHGYSGTGDDLSPFQGWYMKIGTEWMKIHNETASYTNGSVSYTKLFVIRGYFNSTIVSHNAGDIVQIYTSLPEGFED